MWRYNDVSPDVKMMSLWRMLAIRVPNIILKLFKRGTVKRNVCSNLKWTQEGQYKELYSVKSWKELFDDSLD